MSDSLFSPVIDSLGAFAIAIGGYVMSRHNRRIDGMEASIQHEHDDLAQFKLDAATLYAREAALIRIYQLIDEQGKDIKQILQKI